jgi:branched-chain amino acid transport system permease protein
MSLDRLNLERFARIDLCHAPTPLEFMPRLTEHLGGPRLWVKRDDCTGTALGGNKARKLEFLLGEALQQGANHVVTLGALLAFTFSKLMGMNLLLAAVLTMILVSASGWLQDAAIWRPLRKRRVGLTQMMIVSIGLSLVIRYIFQIIYGGDTKVLSQGEIWDVFGVPTQAVNVISAGVGVVILLLVAAFLTKTRIGKATRAVADNASLAAATGIDVERIIRIVWVIAGALTGISGVMLGLFLQASWDMGFSILLLMFAAVTLGGLGTAFGAAVGAMVIGIFVEMSTLVIPTDLKFAGALVVMILVLLIRPQGILGKAQRIG